MTTLNDIQDALEEHYNRAMSVYNYGDHVRLTNGSAAMYIDIAPNGDEIQLVGERYGERIEKSCAQNVDSLIDTLGSTI